MAKNNKANQQKAKAAETTEVKTEVEGDLLVGGEGGEVKEGTIEVASNTAIKEEGESGADETEAKLRMESEGTSETSVKEPESKVEVKVEGPTDVAEVLEFVGSVALPKSGNNNLANFVIGEFKEFFVTSCESKGSIAVETTGVAHARLYQAIKAMFKLEGDQYRAALTTLLELGSKTEAGKYVFSFRKLRRGWTKMRLDATAIEEYDRILTLLAAAADPETREEALKSYCFKEMVKYVDPMYVEKIKGYFGVN